MKVSGGRLCWLKDSGDCRLMMAVGSSVVDCVVVVAAAGEFVAAADVSVASADVSDDASALSDDVGTHNLHAHRLEYQLLHPSSHPGSSTR